jgi:hypothetical protein
MATKSSKWNILLMVAGFFFPLWFPFVYLALLVIEVKFTQYGPLNQLGAFALWATPAIGALSIFMLPAIPLWVKIIFSLLYYFIGLITAGVVGWIVGCSWGVVGCH